MIKDNNESLIPPPSGRVISQRTKEHYGKVINLLRRAVLENKSDGHINDATPMEMAEYVFENRSRLRPQTFLAYRSALVWWLPSLTISRSTQEAWTFLHEPLPADGYKNEKGAAGATTLYSRRSSRKRTVSQKDFNRLINELTKRIDNGRTYVERQRASELRYWLMAGLATGLRPTEWSQAHWKDKSAGQLNVLTAKRKQGNYALHSISHMEDMEYMPMRTVHISDERDVLWVDLHMKSVQAYLQSGEDKIFSRYYDNNRLYLRKICQVVFPNEAGFTLYTLRGQFAANRKISGQDGQDIAEEMGCSHHYATSAYGKQIHGYKKLKGTYRSGESDNDKQNDLGQSYSSKENAAPIDSSQKER